MKIDTAGNVLVTGGGGLGYGTVTQVTSKSTSVTLNTPSGSIVMYSAAFASGASVLFTLNNNLIYNYDIVNITINNSSPSANAYSVKVYYTGINGAYISLTNISAGSLSEAIVLTFNIFKGANS